MLELRPNCEICDAGLPPESEFAYICTYECTFCEPCRDTVLRNVCPNCGGGLERRPIRPARAHRPGLSREHQPPSVKRVTTSYRAEEIEAFADTLADVPPSKR